MKNFLLVLIIVCFLSSVSAANFSDGFESGIINVADWTEYTTNEGRIRVLDTGSPHEGIYHVGLDDSVGGGNSSQTAIYTKTNFTGATDLNLGVWAKEASDEDDDCPASGAITTMRDCIAYTCDGITWFRLIDLPGLFGSYTEFKSQNIEDNCPTDLNSSFAIGFFQYDNAGFDIDGIYFDAIDINYNAEEAPATAPAPAPPLSGLSLIVVGILPILVIVFGLRRVLNNNMGSPEFGMIPQKTDFKDTIRNAIILIIGLLVMVLFIFALA